MEVFEHFKATEKALPVEMITCNDIQLWPFLRVYLASQLIYGQDRRVKLSGSIALRFLRSFSYGWQNLYGQYDYLLFSSSDQRKPVNGQFVDRMDFIVRQLGDALLLELPTPLHYPIDKLPITSIASRMPLYARERIYMKWPRQQLRMEGEAIIGQVLQKHPAQLPWRHLVKRFLGQYRVMSGLLQRYRPKAIFLITPYTNMGYVKAAKDRGVLVVELQHGAINRGHYAYNIPKPFDTNLFPDYLLTFGEKESAVFEENNFYIDPGKVIPVGSFYIDHMAEHYSGDERFHKMAQGYERTVAVVAQDALEPQYLSFLQSLARLSPETLFILIPRHRPESYYDQFQLPENVRFAGWLNTYAIIAQADFHSTINSTTALEALSLGTPNVLFDVENRANAYFGQILTDARVTHYAATPRNYVEQLHSVPRLPRPEVRAANRHIIVPGYEENLQAALAAIL